MTSAIDILREQNNHWDNARAKGRNLVAVNTYGPPVGPNLAVGLSQDFGFDAFQALDWETALEVDILLTHGDRGPLPEKAFIELDAEKQAAADIAEWADLSDHTDLRSAPRPKPIPLLPVDQWMTDRGLARPHA